MKAYIGCIDYFGLWRLLPEDKLPRKILQQLVVGWSSPGTTLVWVVLTANDAEAVRWDLEAGCPATACSVLLNRAVELLPLTSVSADFTETAIS